MYSKIFTVIREQAVPYFHKLCSHASRTFLLW